MQGFNLKIDNKINFKYLTCASLSAQYGKVYDNLTMDSKILNTERSYPVLYLLHGGGGDQTGWVQFGEVMHITDKAIKEGKATSMIIVMPDARGSEEGSKVVY